MTASCNAKYRRTFLDLTHALNVFVRNPIKVQNRAGFLSDFPHFYNFCQVFEIITNNNIYKIIGDKSRRPDYKVLEHFYNYMLLEDLEGYDFEKAIKYYELSYKCNQKN